MEEEKPAVLLVEDEPLITITMSGILRRNGVSVVEAFDAEEAVGLLRAGVFVDAALTDVCFPLGRNGLEFAEWFLEARPGVQIFVTSGRATSRDELIRMGLAKNFIPKPYDMKVLASRLALVAKQRKSGNPSSLIRRQETDSRRA